MGERDLHHHRIAPITVEEVAVYVEGGGRLRVDDLEPIVRGTPMALTSALRTPSANAARIGSGRSVLT